MIRRPPRSTRTYTPFPYTSLFRSGSKHACLAGMNLPAIIASPVFIAGVMHGSSVVIAVRLRRFYRCRLGCLCRAWPEESRSEEHTSELQSLMRISYAVFCLKKQHNRQTYTTLHKTHPK